MITCHDLHIDFNGQESHKYRTKIYQSREDRFFSLVFPEDWWKSIQLYLMYGY